MSAEEDSEVGRPLEIILELFRAKDAGDPFGFSLEEQTYVRRLEDGDLEDARFPWGEEALGHIEAIQREKTDPASAAWLGEALRALLLPLRWEREEARIERALAENRRVVVSLRLSAAELFALPWELVPFGGSGRPLGALPGCLLRYEWPGSRSSPRDQGAPGDSGRIVVAWSAAGGAVPAEEHLASIRRAVAASGLRDFDEARDVVGSASPGRIRDALRAGPVDVLHLLCHGARVESGSTSYGLVLDADDAGADAHIREVIDARSLQTLLAEQGSAPRLIVLCACHGGNPGALENRLGSVAQELHRAGVPAVVASRYPLAVDASVELTDSLYERILVGGASVEEAFVSARDKLRERAARVAWTSIQLYSRSSDGLDNWPIPSILHKNRTDMQEAAAHGDAEGSRASEEGPSSAPGASEREPSPYCEVTLEIVRARSAGDPFAFALEEQLYVRHGEGGAAKSASFPWSEEAAARLSALQRERADPVVAAALGEQIRAFLDALGLDNDEARIHRALDERRPILITLRLGAAELFALPWECVPLGASGVPLGALPSCLLRYEWPQTSTAKPHPAPPPEGGRLVFAWSAAGGAVPAGEHLAAIRAATRGAGAEVFDSKRDVVPNASISTLRSALREAPAAVLHLLCHGALVDSEARSYGLALNGDDEAEAAVVDARSLSLLLADFAGSLRLVVLCACHGGDAGELDSRLGSVAQELHRAGVPAVVASRYPLATAASTALTEALYEGLLTRATSLEAAFLEAQNKLQGEAARVGSCALQLYARAADGADHRPFVPRPFRGLLTFNEVHARYFFGREIEVEETVRDLLALIEAKSAARPRLLFITGASGTGKSSLLLAGVVPALKARISGLVTAFMRPDRRFQASLDAALASRSDPSAPLVIVVDQFEEMFTMISDDAERHAFVSAIIELASSPRSNVSFVAALRVDFLSRCGEIRLQGSERFLEDLAYDEAHRVFLRRMRASAMRRVISEPASQAGLSIERGLVEQMLLDAGNEPGALPLLSYTLDQLWQRRDGRRLLWSSYRELGGVGGALQKKADELIASMNPIEKRAARRLLVQLVSLDDGSRMDRRRRVALDAIRRGGAEEASAFEATLALLTRERLVVLSEGASADGARAAPPILEVAHEQLLRSWSALRAWVREDRQMLVEIHELERWVTESKGFPNYVLDVDRLALARAVLARYPDDINDEAKALIERSQTAVRWRQLRRLAVSVAAVIVGVVMTILAQWALRQRNEALKTASEAQLAEGRAKAAEQEATAQSAKVRSAAMLIGARDLLVNDQPGGAVRLLLEVREPKAARGWAELAHQSLSKAIPTITFVGHTGPVVMAAWSPDGARVVSASADKTARVFRADGSAPPVVLRGHTGGLMSASWSPDGRLVLTTSDDKTMRVFHADGSGKSIVLEGTITGGASAWSPDSKSVLGLRADGSACSWPVDGSSEPVVYEGHAGPVVSVRASPDGGRVLTASKDKTARIFARDGSSPPIVLRGHRAPLLSAIWSPSGDRVVTVSEDGAARVFRADGSGNPIVLEVKQAKIISASVSPDGASVLAVVDANYAVVLRADGSSQRSLSPGSFRFTTTVNPNVPIRRAEFSSDGRHIFVLYERDALIVHPIDELAAPLVLSASDAVLSPDGSMVALVDAAVSVDALDVYSLVGRRRMWPFAAASPLSSFAFSPDAKRVVTTSTDSTVRIWDIGATPGATVTRAFDGDRGIGSYNAGMKRAITTYAFQGPPSLWNMDGTGEPELIQTPAAFYSATTLDGSVIATSLIGDVRLWKGSLETPWLTLMGDKALISGITFSRDGSHLALTAHDKTARVWRADGQGGPVVLRGHSDAVTSAAFSPDGSRIITGSDDDTARIWRADGEGDPIVLKGHGGGVMSVAWSPDGQRVATASIDRTARIWSADGKGEPIVLSGHNDNVTKVVFSPDGARVATTSRNGTVRLWNADGAGESVLLRGHVPSVVFAEFSADSERITTGDVDGKVREWPTTLEGLTAALRKVVTDCLAPDARRTYFGETDAEASARYEGCERAQGRIPLITYVPAAQ